MLVVVAFSLWLPLQLFPNWIQMPSVGMLILLVNPLLIILSFVADTFAGERERHTLESLLASRLSNWSIVAGKIAVLVTLSGGMIIVALLASLVVANIKAGVSSWSFYPPDRFLAFLLLTFAFSLLIAAIGELVSLRAATVRQAQQMLSYGTIALGFIVSFLVTRGRQLPLYKGFASLSADRVFLTFTSGMIIIDIMLVVLVLLLFRRSRLLWN